MEEGEGAQPGSRKGHDRERNKQKKLILFRLTITIYVLRVALPSVCCALSLASGFHFLGSVASLTALLWTTVSPTLNVNTSTVVVFPSKLLYKLCHPKVRDLKSLLRLLTSFELQVAFCSSSKPHHKPPNQHTQYTLVSTILSPLITKPSAKKLARNKA